MAKILVIDDDAQMRRMVVRMLVSAGHEALEAKDGLQGMKVFRSDKPALVLTDLLMPDQEGIETIMALRREAPQIPIMAMSGGSSDRQLFLDAAMKLGADATIMKPFRAAELIAAVAGLLGGAASDSGAG